MAKKEEASLILKVKQVGAEALDRLVITFSDIKGIVDFTVGKIKALGAAMVDMVFEGSKIEQINRQFEFLSKNAGITAETLKNELVGAVDGLADDTDIMMAANRALITMGDHAKEFPKLMSIATASSKLFGGTSVEAFEQIVSALASGNSKALRNIGIVIDQEAAFKKYGLSIGVAASELTKAQQTQALLNATLEHGGASLKDAGSESDNVGEAFTRMKISLGQLYEVFAKLSNSLLGGTFAAAFKMFGSTVDNITNKLTANFGSGAEQAASKITLLKNEIENYRANLETAQKTMNSLEFGKYAQMITPKLQEAQTQLLALEKTRVDAHAKANAEIVENDEKTAAITQEQKFSNWQKQMELDAAIRQKEVIDKQNHNAFMNEVMIANEEERAILAAQYATKNLEAEMAVLDKKLQNTTDVEQKKAILTDKYRLQNSINEAKAKESELKLEKETNDKKISDRKEVGQMIASLSTSNNQTLATIGKAAALTQIAIDTPVAIGKALAAFPPPINFAAAGAVGAAMAAQAARIAGVQLAEGGIVLPRPGGIQATIGEGGQAEAVIPLDRAGEFGLGGGGGVTIIVNGGLLGDQASAREFAIAVDRQLLELRRNNESLSFDERVV